LYIKKDKNERERIMERKWFENQTREDIEKLIKICDTVLNNNPEAWVQRKFKFRKKEFQKKLKRDN
jgi:hypothetical protein